MAVTTMKPQKVHSWANCPWCNLSFPFTAEVSIEMDWKTSQPAFRITSDTQQIIDHVKQRHPDSVGL